MYKKIIFIFLLFTILSTSCRSKKEVNCPSFDIEKNVIEKEKKTSKYRIVILKDGRIINNKKRRKKSQNQLFKKKMY
ncbi:MAG: hypothetical protein CMD02_03490 [Flavobacteriales bacterium]|nr:hypothetical protein [Flavobacteriales bacterium]|tara:strand:+ start:2329 stop:2559 length:231 start_codon:yes stop_codon:yes gene_type:complete